VLALAPVLGTALRHVDVDVHVLGELLVEPEPLRAAERT